MKYILLTVCAIVITLIAANPVNAEVGDVEICVDTSGDTSHSQNLTNTVEAAQTFTTIESFSLTGVKIPLIQSGAGSTLTVGIWPVDGSGRPNSPGGVLGNTTVSTDVLPLELDTAADQNLQCNTTENPGQVIEFDPPILLSAATMYAIVVDGSSSGFGEWGYSINDVSGPGTGLTYTGGIFWTNTASFDDNIPSDWSSSGGTRDSGFAVFGTIVTPDPPNDVNSWLTNFLADFGLNSTLGKLLVAGTVGGFLMILLLALKVPALFALAVGAFAGVSAVTATLISETAFLALVGISGIAIMLALVLRGGNSDG